MFVMRMANRPASRTGPLFAMSITAETGAAPSPSANPSNTSARLDRPRCATLAVSGSTPGGLRGSNSFRGGAAGARGGVKPGSVTRSGAVTPRYGWWPVSLAPLRGSPDDHEPPDLVPAGPLHGEQVHPRLDVLAVARDQVPLRLPVPLRGVVMDLLHEVARQRVDSGGR